MLKEVLSQVRGYIILRRSNLASSPCLIYRLQEEGTFKMIASTSKKSDFPEFTYSPRFVLILNIYNNIDILEPLMIHQEYLKMIKDLKCLIFLKLLPEKEERN